MSANNASLPNISPAESVPWLAPLLAGAGFRMLTDAQLARCYQIRVGRSNHDGPVIVPVGRVDS